MLAIFIIISTLSVVALYLFTVIVGVVFLSHLPTLLILYTLPSSRSCPEPNLPAYICAGTFWCGQHLSQPTSEAGL